MRGHLPLVAPLHLILEDQDRPVQRLRQLESLVAGAAIIMTPSSSELPVLAEIVFDRSERLPRQVGADTEAAHIAVDGRSPPPPKRGSKTRSKDRRKVSL